MDEEIIKYILGGMPQTEFIANTLVAIGGAFLWFIIKTFRSVLWDSDTPEKFEFKYFWRGLIKFGLSVMIIPWVILSFPKWGPFLLNMAVSFQGLDKNLIMKMDIGLAGIVGFGVDAALRRLTHKSFKRAMP